jgi:hypothetical protein
VLEYFSDAFIAFLNHNGARLPDVLRERRVGAPLRHAEADYFTPLRYGDRIEVAMVRCRLEATAVAIGYRVARLADGVRDGDRADRARLRRDGELPALSCPPTTWRRRSRACPPDHGVLRRRSVRVTSGRPITAP